MDLPSEHGYTFLCPGCARALEADRCQVLACDAQSNVRIWTDAITRSYLPVIFGLTDKVPDDQYPFMLHVCSRCYARLRYKHGTELGYRMRDGKTRAYVKERWL